MQTRTSDAVPYAGPRPSPARRWAPWFVLTTAALALCEAVLLVLDLVERDLQDQIATGQSLPRSQIHGVVSMLGTAGDVTLVVSLVGIVVAVGWSRSRRPRARLALMGEVGVEPHLKTVWPFAYWTMVTACGLSFLVTYQAASIHRTARLAQDFVDYRTYRAATHGLLLVACICLIALVRRATRLQEVRETYAPPVSYSAPPAPAPVVPPEVRPMWLVRTFLLVVGFSIAAVIAFSGGAELVSGEGGPGAAAMFAVGTAMLWVLVRSVRVRRTRRLATTTS